MSALGIDKLCEDPTEILFLCLHAEQNALRARVSAKSLDIGCLPRCVARTVLLKLLDHAIQFGIACPKFPCKPVPTALGNLLAVSDHLELPGLARRNDGFNAEALLDKGHETRDLGVVVLSRRAMNDLDLHSVFQSAWCAT
jgi:hypothetical protein